MNCCWLRGNRRTPSLAIWLLPLLLALAGPAQAGLIQFCDMPAEFSIRERDRLFRLGGLVRETLEKSDTQAALISRSGMDLSRFGIRYSHTGISLRDNPNTPWSVRQLYFACEERKPRIFDQGLAAFMLGFDDSRHVFLSLVLLPRDKATQLAEATLDTRQALSMLNARYSANAYPFSDLFQNCNQWVAEMLAAAWGRLTGSEPIRRQAQSWLADRGYRASRFEVSFPPFPVLSALVSWLHFSDHPAQSLRDGRLEISMPESIERFVFESVPGARRVEFCQTGSTVVIRRGWNPIAPDCRPDEGDEVIEID